MKVLQINEEGKPLIARQKLFESLKMRPLDLYKIQITIVTKQCYDIFNKYLKFMISCKNYIKRLNYEKDFTRIKWGQLWGSPQWNKIIFRADLLDTNLDSFYKHIMWRLLKTNDENDNLFLNSIYLQGKSLFKYKSTGNTLELPKLYYIHKGKSEMWRKYLTKIDELYINLSRQESLDDLFAQLFQKDMKVESIYLYKNTDPKFRFLRLIHHMKQVLKHLHIHYSLHLPIQYYLFQSLSLETLTLTLESDKLHEFDLDLLNYLNDKITLKINEDSDAKQTWIASFGPTPICVFNKDKYISYYYHCEGVDFDIDFEKVPKNFQCDDDYLYIHAPSNLNIKKLRKHDPDMPRPKIFSNLDKCEGYIDRSKIKAWDIIIIPIQNVKKFVLDLNSINVSQAIETLIKHKYLAELAKNSDLINICKLTDILKPYQFACRKWKMRFI